MRNDKEEFVKVQDRNSHKNSLLSYSASPPPPSPPDIFTLIAAPVMSVEYDPPFPATTECLRDGCVTIQLLS